MKSLVISGGGSMGAFAGGIAEYLLAEKHRDYNLFVGSSTGALLLPFLALGEIDRIKKIYTEIKHSDIFDVNPIGFSKMEETYKIKVSYLTLISRIFLEERTFGESRNLRRLIKRSLSKELYKRLQGSGKEVVVAVSNLCCEKLEYKSSNDCSYEDFCDWLWASANMIPFMSLLEKGGCFYADGGLGVGVPIHEAVRRGAK
ncbi:MAG TPA: patatin-like phospholipase family protein, partial [Chitinophagales bacterium]|nr:patatin-like phospholipase family protein [Chitinophagales bacterium]